MATASPYIFNQYFNDDGTPLAGGKVFAWKAGTSLAIPKNTFTTAAGDTANANPIILDSNGRADIFLEEGSYDFVIKNSADVVIEQKLGVGGSTGSGTASLQTAGTINDLKALASGSSTYVDIGGHTTQGDGGEGRFYWSAASSATDDNGTVIEPNGSPALGRWIRSYSGPVNVKWFGVDGSADTTAFTNAISALPATGGSLLMPRGSYTLAANLALGSASKPVQIIKEEGAFFTSASAFTVTFYAAPDAGISKFFAGSIVADFSNTDMEFMPPQWWDAFGDGTDIGAAFGKAIDAAITADIPLMLSPGNYLLTTWTEKEISSHLKIIGSGIKNTTITGPNTSTNFLYIRNGLEMQDLKLETWGKAVRGVPATGATSPVDRISFERVWFKTMGTHAINLVGASGENIDSGVRDLLVQNCVFDAIAGYGMEVFYKRIDNCIVDNSRFENFAGSGTLMGVFFGFDLVNEGDTGSPGHARRRSVKITNNYFREINSTGTTIETQAILVHEADDAIVANNVIAGLSNAHATGEDCEGIYIRSVRRAIVQSNIITDVRAGEALIDIKEFCGYAEVVDNVIDNDGYEDFDNSSGILAFIAGGIYARNKIKNVGGFGINLVDYQDIAESLITQNHIESVGALAGIFALCGNRTRIVDNYIRNVKRNYTTNPNYGALSDTNAAGIYIIIGGTKRYLDVSRNTIFVDDGSSHVTANGIRVIVDVELGDSTITTNIIHGVTTAMFFDQLASSFVFGNRGSASVAGLTVTAGNIGNYAMAWDVTNLLFGAGHITFPANQVASAGANDLDDYREGTFTPGLSFGGATTGIVYNSPSGRYTKIGRQVFFEMQMFISNKGSATGAARITGLPFAAASICVASFTVSRWNSMASIVSITGFGENGTANFLLKNADAVTSVDLTDANFTNDSRLFISGSYFV